MKTLHMIAFVLVIVGALNWGLVALFDFNLVTAIFGSWPMLEKWVYIFVGLSGLYIGVTHTNECKHCCKMK